MGEGDILHNVVIGQLGQSLGGVDVPITITLCKHSEAFFMAFRLRSIQARICESVGCSSLLFY